MRLTKKSPDNLVIDEGAATRVIVSVAFVVMGALGFLMGWIKGPPEFLFFSPLFMLIGVYYLLFKKSNTHRFERWRGMVVIDSKGLLGSTQRELPLANIADIVLDERRRPGKVTLYRVYYVTTQGERILWADSHDGSDENTFECFRAAREFLGMPDVPPPIADAPKSA